MSDSDSSGQCTGTKISCALPGVQVAAGGSVSLRPGPDVQREQRLTNVDSVSMFVFPAMTTSTEKDDWTCPGSGKSMTNPTIVAYTFPDVPTNLTCHRQIRTSSNSHRVRGRITTKPPTVLRR